MKEQLQKNRFLYFLLFLLFFWSVFTFFTISWDLPSKFTPETDGITPKLDLSAKEMMKNDTYKYPPLQYLIADFVTKNIPEQNLDKNTLEAKRSERILYYRIISSFMGLGSTILLFLAGIIFLKLPPIYSLAGSCFFLTLSPALFYSQSSNMDMPATFWFLASIFFAVLAEYFYSGKKRKYIFTHLLASLCCACAFCTKDQVYSLYILPSLFLLFLKWKKEKNIQKIFYLCFLWGTTFLFTTLFIYFLIGFEVFLPHFTWITSEGSTPYAAAGQGAFERLKLLFLSLRDLGKAMDTALLLLFTVSAFGLLLKRKEYIKEEKIYSIASLVLCILFSQFLFFCQVVRYSQVRYFLPVLPFLILFSFYIFYRIWQDSPYKKNAQYFLFFLIFLQILTGAAFLHSLVNSPLAQLKRELEASSIYKEVPIYTALARSGERYLQKMDGTIEKRKCIRSWGTFTGLEKYGIKDLFPDDLSLFLLPAQLIITKEKSPFLESDSFVMAKQYAPKKKILPSLYDEEKKEEYIIYSRTGNSEKKDPLSDFKKKSLEEQIIKLAYLLTFHTNFSSNQMKTIGAALASFRQPDSKTFLIPSYIYGFLMDAYRLAGRRKDAENCRRFALTGKI